MFRVEIYGRVRRSVLVEGRSQREVAREFGISRKRGHYTKRPKSYAKELDWALSAIAALATPVQ
jgi:hypothetical protein